MRFIEGMYEHLAISVIIVLVILFVSFNRYPKIFTFVHCATTGPAVIMWYMYQELGLVVTKTWEGILFWSMAIIVGIVFGICNLNGAENVRKWSFSAVLYFLYLHILVPVLQVLASLLLLGVIAVIIEMLR